MVLKQIPISGRYKITLKLKHTRTVHIASSNSEKWHFKPWQQQRKNKPAAAAKQDIKAVNSFLRALVKLAMKRSPVTS